MDPNAPMSRVLSIGLKPFLNYSKSASVSEDTIFHLRTGDDHEQLRHLQIVNIPHENVSLSECWNFLDIPLTSDLDLKMSSVSLLFLYHLLNTYVRVLAYSTTSQSTITDGAQTKSHG